MKQIVILICLSLAIISSTNAQQLGPQSLNNLKESPAGSKILKFVDLVNGNNKLGNAQLSSIFSNDIIKRNSLETLREFVLDIRQNDVPVSIYDVSRTDMLEYNVKAYAGKSSGWLDIVIKMDHGEYMIDWFSWNGSRVPAESKKSMYPKANGNDKKRSKPSQAQMIKKADELAQAYTDLGWFSGAILIAKDGEPIFRKGYGYADIENKISVTPNTVFPTGSMGKDFNQVLILQFIEEGKLSLDDKLSKFNLGFPKEIADKITVRHLLTHSSGFGDIFVPEMWNNREKYKDNKQLLKLHLNSPLLFEPGTGKEYSNYGYTVLALINEEVGGDSYGNLLQKKIFDKIGMANSKYATIHDVDGACQIYTYEIDGSKKNVSGQYTHKSGAGGLVNTIDDLLTFYQALYYTNKLLSDESKVLFANDYESTDTKWKDILQNSAGWSGFAGGSEAMNTAVEYILKDNLFIVISSNTGMISEIIMPKLTAYSLGKEISEPQLPLEQSVYQAFDKKGADYLKNSLEDIATSHDSPYHEGILNRIGYMLLQSEEPRFDKAIEIFKANVDLFPENTNVYDSLGEAYYKKGDNKNAIKCYKKALEIDPEFRSAIKMLKRLKKNKRVETFKTD